MPPSDPLDQRVLARFLLAKYPDRMQVLAELCEKTGMPVDQAEALLERVQASLQQETQQAWSPGKEGRAARMRAAALVAFLVTFLVAGMVLLLTVILPGK